jgi:hypothetical protein
MIMQRSVTLQEAIATWSNHLERPEPHISPEEMYELLMHPAGISQDTKLLLHLSQCPVCLQEFQEIVQSREDAAVWDLALPRAAATEDSQWPKNIPVEGGKYIIEIRRSLSRKNHGMITLRVTDVYRETLEGKTVCVTDETGRSLLHGQIIDGEFSQTIDDLKNLGVCFCVRPE